MDTVLPVGKLFWHTEVTQNWIWLDKGVIKGCMEAGKPWEQGFKQSCNYEKKGKLANVTSAKDPS